MLNHTKFCTILQMKLSILHRTVGFRSKCVDHVRFVDSGKEIDDLRTSLVLHVEAVSSIIKKRDELIRSGYVENSPER